jgi:hypothetical protein
LSGVAVQYSLPSAFISALTSVKCPLSSQPFSNKHIFSITAENNGGKNLAFTVLIEGYKDGLTVILDHFASVASMTNWPSSGDGGVSIYF